MQSSNVHYHSVIDVEASGLDSRSYPIEVGVVLGDGRTYEALIKPQHDWRHWSKEAEYLHGLSRDDLARDGKPAAEVCRELNKFCAGQTVYSDCWVIDTPWLTKLFAVSGVQPTFRCSPIEAVVDESLLDNWGYRKAAYAREVGLAPHRALNDAVIIAGALQRITESPVRHHHHNRPLHQLRQKARAVDDGVRGAVSRIATRSEMPVRGQLKGTY